MLLGTTLLFPLEGSAQETPVNEKELSVAEKLIEEHKAQKALDILLPLAELNNAEAQNLLGELYHFGGEGVPVDYQKAQEWYLKAFQHGNAEAANHLGRLYLNGEGVSPNPQEAEKWYQQSMLKGSVNGEISYYSLVNRPFAYILQRANSGDSEAQNLVGELYHMGAPGIEINYNKAREWYLKAVKGGNGVAANHLGRLYLNGEGVQKDEKEAAAWYKKGMELGDEAAKHNYETAIERLQK